jgi:hypothetical protein
VSDEERQYLDLDGAPLPLIDPERGRCYMLMPVNFTRGPGDRVIGKKIRWNSIRRKKRYQSCHH